MDYFLNLWINTMANWVTSISTCAFIEWSICFEYMNKISPGIFRIQLELYNIIIWITFPTILRSKLHWTFIITLSLAIWTALFTIHKFGTCKRNSPLKLKMGYRVHNHNVVFTPSPSLTTLIKNTCQYVWYNILCTMLVWPMSLVEN